MISDKFINKVIKLAIKQGHWHAAIYHALKVLLTTFDRPKELLESSGLVDVGLLSKMIDEKLSELSSDCNFDPIVCESVWGIVRNTKADVNYST